MMRSSERSIMVCNATITYFHFFKDLTTDSGTNCQISILKEFGVGTKKFQMEPSGGHFFFNSNNKFVFSFQIDTKIQIFIKT